VIPSPGRLYVHDDLTEALAAPGVGAAARELGRRLLARLARDPRVVVGTLAAEAAALAAHGPHAPFAITVVVGAAGARAAQAVHARTGWFPRVHRVDVWREEDATGRLVLAGPAPLGAQLAAVDGMASVAVVDDTVYSGLTLDAVLAALPPAPGRRLHAFCLRGVEAGLAVVARRAPLSAGVVLPGRPDVDVSVITAAGLVRRGAIRRAGAPSLAFFERPAWMAAWFPDDAPEVIALCRALAAHLEPAEARPVTRGARWRAGAGAARPGGRAPRRGRGSPGP